MKHLVISGLITRDIKWIVLGEGFGLLCQVWQYFITKMPCIMILRPATFLSREINGNFTVYSCNHCFLKIQALSSILASTTAMHLVTQVSFALTHTNRCCMPFIPAMTGYLVVHQNMARGMTYSSHAEASWCTDRRLKTLLVWNKETIPLGLICGMQGNLCFGVWIE